MPLYVRGGLWSIISWCHQSLDPLQPPGGFSCSEGRDCDGGSDDGEDDDEDVTCDHYDGDDDGGDVGDDEDEDDENEF